MLPELRDSAVLPNDVAERAVALERRAERFEDELQVFLRKRVDDEKQKSKLAKIAIEDSTGRLANQHIAQAIDATLVDVFQVGYSYFRPDRFPTRLGPFEERYFEDAELYPGGPTRRRSCVEDTNSEVARFEMSYTFDGEQRVHPTLHRALDEGSIGFAEALWCYGRQKVRGTMNIDHSHRCVRDQDGATNDAGLRLVKARAGAVCNFAVGPWDKQAFFHVVRESALEMFEMFDENWIVYRLQYPAICRAHGDSRELVNSPEHIKAKFTAIKVECPLWIKMGLRSVFGRWMSHEAKSKDIFMHLPTLQLPLIYHGMKKSWWATVFKSPLCVKKFYVPRAEIDAELARLRAESDDSSDDSDDEMAEGAAVPLGVVAEAVLADDKPVKMTVAMSKAEVYKMKTKGCKHTLSFISLSINDERFMRLWQSMIATQTPFKNRLGQDHVLCRSKLGCVEFSTFYCRGDFLTLLDDTLAAGFDPDLLYQLNFTDPSDTHPLQEDIAEETYILNRSLKFALEFSFNRYLSLLEYRMFPKYFINLLTKDQDELREVLSTLAVWWTWICRMDKVVLVDRRAKDWFDSIVQVDWVFVREIFVQLDEARFEAPVPPFVLEDILAFAHSQLGTVIDENAMRILAAKQRTHPSKQVSRMTRYHALLTSGLWSDYGRKQVEVTTTAREIAGPTVAKGIFDTNGREFSFGLRALQALAEDSPSWKTMGPLNYRAIGVSWQSFSAVNGEFDKLKTGWLSRLARQGTMIYKRGESFLTSGGLVWGITKESIVVWTLRLEGVPDNSFVWASRRKPSKADNPCRILVINDRETLADWRVTDLKMLPPSVVLKRSGGLAPAVAMLCADGARAKTILQDAATHAFPNLVTEQLKALVRIEKVPVDEENPPIVDADTCRVLVKHYLGHLTDEEVAAIVALRGKDTINEAEQECSKEMLEEDNLALLKAVLQGTDVLDKAEEIKKDILKKLKAAEQRGKPKPGAAASSGEPLPGAEEPLPGAGGPASSSGSGGLAPPAPFLIKVPSETLEVAEAKKFLPHDGVLLYKEMKWHTRWYSKYPVGEGEPIIQTKVFSVGTGLTDNEAMRWVLNAVWEVHCDVTKESCPWDFSF